MKSWEDFDKFYELIGDYLPIEDEGITFIEQLVTAVNKLLYKWFNDGDIYDNNYILKGWENDISTYANWLYTYTTDAAKVILMKIKDCKDESEYVDLLYELCDELIRPAIFSLFKNDESISSIYTCLGPFKFERENNK